MQDYGVFNDEGCIFASDSRPEVEEYAQKEREEDPDYAELISVAPMCMDHRDAEQPTDACDECTEEY